MSNTNERPDFVTRQTTSDENKPKQPKELEKKMEELRIRFQMEKSLELERQKEILQKNYEAELQRLLHEKDKELKEAKSETKRVKEDLTLQVRDAERRLAQTPPVYKEGVSRKLVTEVVELKGVKRRLEEALGDVMDSDKRKTSELRKLHDQHAAELGKFKREAENDIRKLLAELRVKDRIIRQHKRELWIANERLVRYQCQSQNSDKTKTGSQDDGNDRAANTHNLISTNSSSPISTFNTERRNSNKRKYVCNSTQSSDVEEKQNHDAEQSSAKHKERKILKTGQVPETMYKRLYKEHLELQRSFALLRQMITDTKGERGKCKNIMSLADENQRLQQISQHLKNKIQKLRHELKESRDQNELLEFCVLEMENQGKANLVPKLVEQGINTDPSNECSPIITECSEFDFMVETYPCQELNEEQVKEIRKSMTCLYSAQGSNASNKQRVVQATAHIQAAFTAMSNLHNLVISLTKDIEVARKEKENHMCCISKIKENYEQYKQHLEETEKEAMSQTEKAGILQASPNPLEVAKKSTVISSKSLENSNCSDMDNNTDIQFKSNVETVEEFKLEIQKHKLIVEEFAKQQKELLQNCNELSAKLTEYEGIKYDLMQKIAVLEKSEQDLVEKNLKLYIDYVSAKEEVQKLLVELENRHTVSSPTLSLEVKNVVPTQHSDVQRTLSEESGTMTSEDEGLGEESRRGDSTGPSSLADLQESEEELITRTSDLESEVVDEQKSDMETSQNNLLDVRLNNFAFIEECEKIKLKWKKEVAELKEREKILIKQLKYSQTQISELRENIKVKEEQVRQLLGRDCLLRHDKCCEEELQQVIKNMQKDLLELEQKLSLTEHSKNSLKEQVLELEEAENDARLVGQKLQEKLNLAVYQGNSIQRELDKYKNYLEVSNKIQSHNTSEIELQSQIKYMEFLIYKYEDHIKELETSKMKLKQRVFCLEQFLHSTEALPHSFDQQMTDKSKNNRDDNHSEDLDCENICTVSNPLTKTDAEITFNQCSDNLHEKLFLSQDISMKGNSYPIKDSKVPSLILNTIPIYTHKINDLKSNPSVSFCSSFSTYLSVNLNRESNSVQKELMQRLCLLEKDDQTLREQLHHMDEMNLELWKKLHSLETHVGQCMKEYISELNESNSVSFLDLHQCNVESPNNFLSNQQIIKLRPHCQTESKILPEMKHDDFMQDIIPSNTDNILQRVLFLETSEHKLKDRLLQLENINREFEKELEIRESLYKEKESQQKKWLELQNTLQETIRTLENEKSNLLNEVLKLEEEKLVLNRNIENLQTQLELLKKDHIQALQELEIHREKALNELEVKQNNFGELAKEKAEKIVALEQSVVDISSSKILEFEKHNLITGELEMLKKDHATLRENIRKHKDSIELTVKDFETQFNALIKLQKSEEEKLKLEIENLISKEKEHNLQIMEMLQKQTVLENELISKETELEQVKKQFSEQMKLLEDEHHVVEEELKWKMKEMEENAAVTIKALTEERSQLESDLQANLKDLHMKEESYKLRIAELEGCVETLRKEVNKIASADSLSDNEKRERESHAKSFHKKMEELQKNEKQMKAKLIEMEKKEEAYKETLDHAEKIISTLERNYTDKIEELESSERALKLRVSQLEEVENRLRCTLHNEKRTSEMRKASDLIEELMEGEIREVGLRERIKELESNQKTLIEKLQELEKSRRYLQEELGDHDELVRTIEKLQQQQEILKKELLTVQQSKNDLQETLDHADDILIQREDELRQSLVHIENEKKELEETTEQLRKQVKELQTMIETSQYGKVSPIGEHLYETFSNCDSEEEFQQSDESFYMPEKIDANVQKVKELERIGNELKQEVTHLKQSLSAANAHLVDLDNVNRNQQMTISQLEEEKSLMLHQIKNSENLENKCKELEQLCNEQEKTKLSLLENLKKLQEREKCGKGHNYINSQLWEQECEDKIQSNSKQCDVQMDTTDFVKKYEVQDLAKLCQTVLNNVRTTFSLKSDKENNECVMQITEHYGNMINNNILLEGENNVVANMSASEKHSPIMWSAVPGMVSLDDLTTGLEAQLELEQCVKRAMAAMEREMMQKETSHTPADNRSVSNIATNVTSTSSKALTPFVEHSPNVSNKSKGTITKCKTKILDVSELQQSHKSLSSDNPDPPRNFRVLRQIGDHSLLVGWSVPNEGCTIGGYQIYVDGQLHQKVRSPDRTKALLPKINVFQPVSISIYSISTSGHSSEPVSILHPGTISKPEHPLSKKEMPYMCTTEHSCVLRIRTMYNEGYDVPVQKGSTVLVCSTPDSDGFCTVQVEGQEGKLPFNLLKETENISW